MKPEHERRWLADVERGGLKSPRDLMDRPLSNADYVDSAVIGGVAVADIIEGRVDASQIPHDVLKAYSLQYPHGDGFVETVRRLEDDPEALRGLINGVKGKLFEIGYVEHLNEILPKGWKAELAVNPVQPGWDIRILDAHGHVDEVLQLKATQSIAYVHEALDRYPHDDIVVTHELYERLLGDGSVDNLIDAGVQNDALQGVVSAAAVKAAMHFSWHGVEMVVAFAAAQNLTAYLTGRMTLAEMLKKTGTRGALSIVARAAAIGAVNVVGTPLVGVPVSVGVRLLCGQVMHNLGRRKELRLRLLEMEQSITKLREVCQAVPG